MNFVNKRIDYIDFIKGCCIFLVVWAHSIQNMGSDDAFWGNPVHIFICSFHMPIFMLISGFFFDHSTKKTLLQITKKKFIQLILPCFGWSFILILINTIGMIINEIPISVFEQIKSLFYETGTRFWFLRSVFICYIYAIVSLKVFKKDYIAFIISFLILLSMPDNFRLAMDKFMYPYFWTGYFIHKYIDIIYKYRKIILSVSFVVFLLLLIGWDTKYYIYVTGMSFYAIEESKIIFFPFLEKLSIVSYRYFIGFWGCMFFFLLLKELYNPKWHLSRLLKELGKYTLGIYVIHIFVEGMILKQINLPNVGFFAFNFLITPAVSVLLIFFCVFLIKLLQKNRMSSFLFLGRYPKSKYVNPKS